MCAQAWEITNATLVGPDGPVTAHGLRIENGLISNILKPGESDSEVISLNLHGLQLFPGLINGHDSLMATYHSYRGENWPYSNWLSWDNDLKSSQLFRDRMVLDIAQLYQLGAYRNLLSGVTTVIDHIPEFIRSRFYDSLPVSLLKEFGIAHSVGDYSLNWGDGIGPEMERASRNNAPFIIHIAEGFDKESRRSLKRLDKEGGLSLNTVLVHGLSLDASDIHLIKEKQASLVWCPTSNLFLYDAVPPIDHLMNAGVPVILGTDSPMAGGGSITQEMAKAREIFEEIFEMEIHPARIMDMVTSTPAKAFRLTDRGELAPGLRADLLVIEGKYRDPYLSLCEARPEEIFLVSVGGKPAYADATLSGLFDALELEYDEISVNGRDKIVISGLKNVLEVVAGNDPIYKKFDFLPVDLPATR